MEVAGELSKPKAHISIDSTEYKVSFNPDGRMVNLGFQLDTLGMEGWWRMAGNVWMDSRIWEGRGQRQDGTWFEWSAIRKSEQEEEVNEWNAQPRLGQRRGDLGLLSLTEMPSVPSSKRYGLKVQRYGHAMKQAPLETV